MKKLLLIAAAILGLVSVANAGEVCSPIRDGVTVEAANQNYDGSWTYQKPRVLVNGEMLLINWVGSSSVGVCPLFGKSYVHATHFTIPGESVTAVLDSAGEFVKTSHGVYSAYATVTCR